MTSRRERLYRRQQIRRKRRIIKAISIIILTIVVLLVLGATYIYVPEAEAYEYHACSTLWELAERYCPEGMEKQRYIAEVMELNAMTDSTVYPKRLYMVPIY